MVAMNGKPPKRQSMTIVSKPLKNNWLKDNDSENNSRWCECKSYGLSLY